MLDIAPTELLLVAFVALVVIGPKDLPKAMRVVGYWVGKARGVGRQFRQGFDTMVREAEVEEMEKKWAAENERIMREHPMPTEPSPTEPSPTDDYDTHGPVMVEKPVVHPAADAAIKGTPVAIEHPVVEPSPESIPAARSDTTPS